MKIILVPTDFSKNSINAIEYSIELAKKENAKIILLHAFHVIHTEPNYTNQNASEVIAVFKKKSDKQLQSLYLKIIKPQKVKCELLSKYDLAVNAIIETIKEKKTDFIVMGTKGASGIKEILMGSNTASIIEKANCPVIAIPEGAKFKGIKKITYATDYRESDVPALKNLIEIAKPFNAEILVLHASDDEFTHFSEEVFMNEFMNKIQKKINYKKLVYKLVYGKHLTKVLDKHIEQNSPDLIAMSTRHRNMFDKIFGTSITKKMAYHTKMPLIVFHYKQALAMYL